MSDEPFEPDDGQDGSPPDVGLALLVATHLLLDLRDHLEAHRERKSMTERFGGEHPREDLLLRIGPVVAVLRAARERVTHADDR